MEWVQLVDEQDQNTEVMEKLAAHVEGKLHRAISVLVFNSRGDMLLQRRALEKYHSGGLWTNTCCTHPRPGETPAQAASRRLKEEMGMDCVLDYRFKFIYKAALDKGLVEHELDYVFFGQSEAIPAPAPEEVSEWQYMPISVLEQQIQLNPESFTAWFRIIFDKIKSMPL